MLEVAPEEQNLAKIFKLLAAIFSFLSVYMVWLVFFGNSSSGLWVGIFAFSASSALLFVIGKYHQDKYENLGDTILFLESANIALGGVLSGKVSIKQPHFSKVNKVCLTNLVYYGGHYNNRYEILVTVSTDCQLVFENDITWIEFHIKVPSSGRETSKRKNNHFYWELSIKYTENLSLTKRTWPVQVFSSPIENKPK
jgi:hypothetical protein